jgi:regulator of nucleoside diphosphate kinase
MNRIYISTSDNAKLRAVVTGTLYTDENYVAANAELNRALIGSADDELANIITMGATFSYEECDHGRVAELTLCFPDEVSTTPHGLSVFSPMGIAVIGCRVNDVVSWSTRTGVRRIVIRAVSASTARSGVATRRGRPSAGATSRTMR